MVARITATLLAANVWNLDVSLCMYFRTDVLSVQNTEGSSGSSSSSCIILSIRTATVAAVSSILGIVIGLSGTTLALAMMKEQ